MPNSDYIIENTKDYEAKREKLEKSIKPNSFERVVEEYKPKNKKSKTIQEAIRDIREATMRLMEIYNTPTTWMNKVFSPDVQDGIPNFQKGSAVL